MALSIVQSTKTVAGSVASGAITFTSTPTVGNLMLIAVGYASSKTITTLTGWTQLDKNTQAGVGMAVFYRVVQAGDGKTYTFSLSGGDYLNLAGVEISGQAASSFINQHNMTLIPFAGANTTYPSGSVTPSVASCLALSFFAQNEADVIHLTPPYTNTISAGWSIDQAAHDQYHAIDMGHKTAITSDTTTAITTTWTDSTETDGADSIVEIILLAPAATTTQKISGTYDMATAEKTDLATKYNLLANPSLHDLRVTFYGPSNSLSQNDSIRAYLQTQLSNTTTQSLNDLWRLYFISKGVANQVSLSDMANQFFTNVGF